MGTINERIGRAGEKQLTEALLDAIFERNWPDLETQLTKIVSARPLVAAPRRDVPEMLAEALQILRELERRGATTLSELFREPGLSGARGAAAALAKHGLGLEAALARAPEEASVSKGLGLGSARKPPASGA